MMTVSLRLVEEDALGNEKNSLWIRPEFPSSSTDTIACNSFDLGYPEVKEAISDVTQGNGVTDLTRFHGRSTVTLDLTLIGPDKVIFYEVLRGMCQASKRLWLYVNRSDWSGERRLQLRPNAYTFVSDRSAATRWKVNLSFSNPSGRMQAVTSSSTSISLGEESGGITGIVFPIVFPITWPAVTQTNQDEALNEGTADVLPQIIIGGQCKGPKIIFKDIGTTMYFPNLLVDNDHYLLIDVPSKQILMDGDINNSRFRDLSMLSANGWNGWPYLAPGNNAIEFQTNDRDGNCFLRIDYRSEWV